MGWEFAALWVDESGTPQWVWRRIADDSGDLIAESTPFAHLDLCMADARAHGFDESSDP